MYRSGSGLESGAMVELASKFTKTTCNPLWLEKFWR